MKMKWFICFLTICIAVNSNAQTAGKKKKGAKQKTYFKLIEAYTQQSVQGRLPQTGTHFIIVWETASYPETFFWRGDNGWLSCKVEQAHKINDKLHNAKGINYTTKMITSDQIHRGDTLELSPITGGRFPIPSEIPATAKNTLFFKTGGSKWLSYPVKTIRSKPDMATP